MAMRYDQKYFFSTFFQYPQPVTITFMTLSAFPKSVLNLAAIFLMFLKEAFRGETYLKEGERRKVCKRADQKLPKFNKPGG